MFHKSQQWIVLQMPFTKTVMKKAEIAFAFTQAHASNMIEAHGLMSRWVRWRHLEMKVPRLKCWPWFLSIYSWLMEEWKKEIQCTTFFMIERIELIGGIFRLTGPRSRSSHRWFESKDNRSWKKASCQPYHKQHYLSWVALVEKSSQPFSHLNDLPFPCHI